MSSLKLVLDVGAQFLLGYGKAIDSGIDMAMTAAQVASYIYPADQDPGGAFSWWLSACPSDLVPDDIRKVFEILNQVGEGISSFKKPKNIHRGSGRKGDKGNPRSPSTPRKPAAGSTTTPKKKQKCRIPPKKKERRMGQSHNTLRRLSCNQDETETQDTIITSITYASQAKATHVTRTCNSKYSQACYHYSSVIRVNKQWATITCPDEAGKPSWRYDGTATATWRAEHTQPGWREEANRALKGQCDMDEYPPASFGSSTDPAWKYGGKDKRSQRIRYIPWDHNQPAGRMFKGICFAGPLKALSSQDFEDLVEKGSKSKMMSTNPKPHHFENRVGITVDVRPDLSLAWSHQSKNLKDDGLWDNPCWPAGLAVGDPGFALLSLDDWYDANPKGKKGRRTKWDYSQPYKKGSNGD